MATVAGCMIEVPALPEESAGPPVTILSWTLSNCTDRSACWVRSPALSCASFVPSGEFGSSARSRLTDATICLSSWAISCFKASLRTVRSANAAAVTSLAVLLT